MWHTHVHSQALLLLTSASVTSDLSTGVQPTLRLHRAGLWLVHSERGVGGNSRCKRYMKWYIKVHMEIYIKNEQTGGEFDEWWGQENVSANKQNNLVCKVCWYPLLKAGAWPTDRHIPVTIGKYFHSETCKIDSCLKSAFLNVSHMVHYTGLLFQSYLQQYPHFN